MDVDVIVVSYNTRELLRACLASLARHASAANVFVADNASSDGSAAMVATEFPEVHLLALDENIGFGPANNRAAALGTAEDLLLLNPDAEVTEGAVQLLFLALAAHPGCVAVGPKLMYGDGRFQASCRNFPTPLSHAWSLAGFEARLPGRCPNLRNWLTEPEHRPGRCVDMLSGACFMVRRSFFQSVGGFDENLFMYEEETDLFLPARRRGLEVRYCPEAVVIHHGGSSIAANRLSGFSERQLFRSKYAVFRKHYGRLAARATYCMDCLILGASAGLNRARKSPSMAGERLRRARRAWRESFMDVETLRGDSAFFED